MIADRALVLYVGLGLVAVAVVAYALKNSEALGRGLVNAADGLVSGTVKGVGSLVGVPDTDEQKCAAAMAAGRTWDASFYCPAGTWLKYIVTPSSAPAAAPRASSSGCSCFAPPCNCDDVALNDWMTYGYAPSQAAPYFAP